VQSVAVATVERRALADRDDELVAYALSRTTDTDAHVRAAAFTALSRVSHTLPLGPVQHGLADPDAIVRMAAAQTLPLVEGNRLNLLAALDRADPGVGRTARHALRAHANGTAARPEPGSTAQARIAWFRSVSVAPSADAEEVAVQALEDPDVSVRREAALALAAIARSGGLRLHRPAVDALLTRLEAEGAGPVSGAIVEALEATDDERAPMALSTLAARAKPTWRLRLTEAAALARRARAAAERRGRHRSSGRVPRPAR
jgi:hypothetical protein